MTDNKTPPDWVLLEASKRAGLDSDDLEWLASLYSPRNSFSALCDMIEKYEKPPPDRKVLCAREASRQLGGQAGWENSLNLCIRAIELYEEGFGK